jgi:hypothetical protein
VYRHPTPANAWLWFLAVLVGAYGEHSFGSEWSSLGEAVGVCFGGVAVLPRIRCIGIGWRFVASEPQLDLLRAPISRVYVSDGVVDRVVDAHVLAAVTDVLENLLGSRVHHDEAGYERLCRSDVVSNSRVGRMLSLAPRQLLSLPGEVECSEPHRLWWATTTTS